jgi:hypothetical protein
MVLEKTVTKVTERVVVNLADRISMKACLDEEVKEYFADTGYKEDFT